MSISRDDMHFKMLLSSLTVTDVKIKKVRVPEVHTMRDGKPLTVGKVYDVIECYTSHEVDDGSAPMLGIIEADNGDHFLIRFAGCAHLSSGAGLKSTVAWEIVE